MDFAPVELLAIGNEHIPYIVLTAMANLVSNSTWNQVTMLIISPQNRLQSSADIHSPDADRPS